jgi:crotonobetaine/carnitine-CoA ligase
MMTTHRSTNSIAGDTVLAALQRAKDSVPDSVFLDFGGDLYTYADVWSRSIRLAHGLEALGVGAGDRVVTVLDNNIDLVSFWFALGHLGAVWVPVNTAYKGEFLRHQMADSGARLAICEEDYLARVTAVVDGTEVARVLLRGDLPSELDASVPVEPLDEHRGTDDTAFAIQPQPGDLACLIYTSGTTGPSKGCMISHNYLCNQGRQLNCWLPPAPGDVTWTCLPMFHTSALGTLASALLVQGRVAVAAQFSVSDFWPEIERSGATRAVLMAAIFPWVAHAPDSDAQKRCFGQLKAITGVPITPEVRAIWQERFGVRYVNSFGYGQSEGVYLAYSPETDPAPLQSCGRIAEDDFEVEIHGEAGQRLPDGEVGEIVFRPRKPNIMFAGYWKRPEATAEVWRDLWMHTGDLGRLENGYLFFVDRKKDYLRSRGENISSFEVERTFMTHPAVAEVAVHTVDAFVAEDAVKVTVVVRQGESIEMDQLCHWSIDNLPHFAVPRYFEARSDLPRTPNGRVQKYQLRKDGITPSTWDREKAGVIVRRRRS